MTLLIVVLTTVSAIRFPSSATADDDSPPQNPPETEEPDLEVQSLELDCKMAELAVAQAELAVTRVQSRLQAAKAKEDRDEIPWLELDLKEASLELQIRKLQLGISHVHLDRAKIHQQRPEDTATVSGDLTGPVQIEYLEGMDGIVLRGNKSDVERVARILREIESGPAARELAAAEPESAAAEPESPAAEPESPAAEPESPAAEAKSPAAEAKSPAAEPKSPAAEAGFRLSVEGPDKASVAEGISVTCTLTTTQDHGVSGDMRIEYSESLRATAASSGFQAGIPPLVWPTEEIAAGVSRQWSVKFVCDKPDTDAAVKFTFSPRDGQKVTETLKLSVSAREQ